MSPRQILTTVTTIATLKSVKENVFFSESDQDRDTKKKQALSITFSQFDWFIPPK